ncbi:ABC transporter permease [Spirulina subsalsa]|uniref:ABC transporter permease n=1 Tax=Spirulina subsalsa TaxID=54311 RepID=UPI000317FC02|nr:ABC transporter permease [Spirulina subsalsa]
MPALDRKLFRDLGRLWGQALAIALVVACGIACFVMAQSAYNSLQLTQQTYYDRYHFAEVFASVKRAPNSLEARIQDIPGVAQTETRIVVDVNLNLPDRVEPATGRLISIPPQQHPRLNDIHISQGRYIAPNRGDEILISEAFAEANDLAIGDKIGAVINGRWQQLQIVGIALSPEYIYEVRGGADIYPDSKSFGLLWISRDALGSAFNMDGAFNNITLTLSPQAREVEVVNQLDHILDGYGSLGAYGRSDQLSHRIISDEITSLEVTATMLPTIFLAIAAFLLNIVLSRLVGTQREQIGVLKAFGYGFMSIGAHYLKFVLAIILGGSILGTLGGLWLGKGLTELYTEYFRFPLLTYHADSRLILGAIAISAIAAILGGVIPVHRAAVLPPAVAMRPEPPTEYKPTIIEKLGLQGLFSPSGRIILRNLERKPIQAALSILGVAVAVAILMTGSYLSDALNYLMDVQFRQVQREDMTIVFTEPRPARTRHEIAQWQGVLQSETFRSVPARLRHEHYQYRLGLTGIDPQGQFRRLLDDQLRPVRLPSQGVVMTQKLGEILHLKIGDILTVEVLEGSRPVREVPVVGFVEEMVGVNAYMDITALNEFMQEGATVSGAYLSVDAKFLKPLYEQLKQMPGVAGISTRESMLNSFEKISGQNLKVFTGVLVVFAVIITFSVVYNSARIALSERSRELASLRIIGFSRQEVAFILLGEQAILIVAAIPVGMVFGYGLSALMSMAYNTEMYRVPLVIQQSTYIFTSITVLFAAAISGFLIRKQLNGLNLVEVLKTRE